LKIVLMETNRRASRLFYFARRQEVVEMGMRVENMANGQPQCLHLMENLFWCPTWIDDDRLLRDRITDDGTITAEGRD
jgi:hypothetical protein